MPIKQVVCSICKETVNKAQTYHVGGTDRACKKHEGVIEKKTELDQAKARRALEQLQKDERRLDSMRGQSWSGDYMTPKCWVCMNKGIRAQEFMFRYLIEVEKERKVTGKGGIPLFNTNVKMKERCIFVLSKEKGAAALKYVREDFRTIVDMGGIISIYADCCHLNKIDPFPKVEFEDLVKFIPISEMVIRPAVEAQATKEVIRDS